MQLTVTLSHKCVLHKDPMGSMLFDLVNNKGINSFDNAKWPGNFPEQIVGEHVDLILL